MGHSKATRSQHVMTTLVFFVTPGESQGNCPTRMTEKRFRHLPLVRDDQVVGLISIGEVGESIIAGKNSTMVGLENFPVYKVYPHSPISFSQSWCHKTNCYHGGAEKPLAGML